MYFTIFEYFLITLYSLKRDVFFLIMYLLDLAVIFLNIVTYSSKFEINQSKRIKNVLTYFWHFVV